MAQPPIFVEVGRSSANSFEPSLPASSSNVGRVLGPKTNLIFRLCQFSLAMFSMSVLASTTRVQPVDRPDRPLLPDISFANIHALNFLITIMAFVFIYSFWSALVSVIMIRDPISNEFGRQVTWWHLFLDMVLGGLSFAAASAGAGVLILLHEGVSHDKYGEICQAYTSFCARSDVGVAFGFFTSFVVFYTAWLFARHALR